MPSSPRSRPSRNLPLSAATLVAAFAALGVAPPAGAAFDPYLLIDLPAPAAKPETPTSNAAKDDEGKAKDRGKSKDKGKAEDDKGKGPTGPEPLMVKPPKPPKPRSPMKPADKT